MVASAQIERFLEREASASPPEIAIEANDETAESLNRSILCWSCRSHVTNTKSRVRVAGAHEHRFMNPHGHFFRFGCFRAAPGAQIHGPASDEYAWFPGFAWSLAVCRACQLHLGWKFENSSGDVFFGLILERIVEADES
jgi:hypothetical protein